MIKNKIQTLILLGIHLIPVIFFLFVFPFVFSGTLIPKLAFSLCGAICFVYSGSDFFSQIRMFISDEGIIYNKKLLTWNMFELKISQKGSYLIMKCKNIKKPILIHQDLYGNKSSLTSFLKLKGFLFS